MDEMVPGHSSQSSDDDFEGQDNKGRGACPLCSRCSLCRGRPPLLRYPPTKEDRCLGVLELISFLPLIKPAPLESPTCLTSHVQAIL